MDSHRRTHVFAKIWLSVPVWLGFMFALAITAETPRAAHAQLVVGTSNSAGAKLALIDLSGANSPRVLVDSTVCSNGCNRIDGLTADNSGQVLYWSTAASPRTLYKAAYTPSGLLSPVSIGALANSVGSLAWDSVASQLIGFDNSGRVWLINTAINTPNPGAAGSMTLLYTMPSIGTAFYGGDFDATTNAFYGAAFGDAQAPGRAPLGLYRYNKPHASPTITFVSGYPDNAFIGFRGLAVGNGRVYLGGGSAGFSDQPAVLNHVYNQVTNTYETPPIIPVSGTIQALTWAPGLLTPAAGVELVANAGGPTSCTVSPGGDMTFSVHVENYGSTASGPVTLTVDVPSASAATFTSSTPPPTSITATQLTYVLPPVPGYGPTALFNVAIHLSAAASDTDVAITATASVSADINVSNNTIVATSHTKPVAPTTATIKGVFSTDPTRNSSFIPGGNGARFVDFNDPYASPDGSRWVIVAATNDPSSPFATARNRVLVRAVTGGTPAVLVQKNVTVTTPPTGLAANFDTQVSVNNAGTVVFSDGGGSLPRYIAATTDGVSFTDIARQGQPIPSMPGIEYGNSMGCAHLFSNGQVGFSSSSSPEGNQGYFTANGGGLLAREGVTVPIGASGPLDSFWNTGGSTGYFNIGFDATASHSIYQGEIGDTTGVLVADGTVVIESGTTVLAPGIIAGDPALEMSMGAGGTWMYPDRSGDRQDVLVRGHGATIDQVYKTGDPIFTGATEHWSDLRDSNASFNPADTFFTYNSDINGHYVIGGYTDSSDVYTDSVLVYDNQVVIARENDPVDLDGNGVFDDNVFVRAFVKTGGTGGFEGPVAFTNDNAILACVSLRDGEAALCKQFDGANYIWAVVRIPLPPKGACCNGTTCSVGSPNFCSGTYRGDNSTCQAPGNPTTCCPANFDGMGGIQVQDIFAFLNAWFAGSPSADFNGGGLSVSDIFAFLNAWFAGC